MNAAAAAADDDDVNETSDDAYDKCGFSLMILVWYSLFSIGVNLDIYGDACCCRCTTTMGNSSQFLA